MDMKRIFLSLLVAMASMAGNAQIKPEAKTDSQTPSSIFTMQPFFGYLSYSTALESMPQYVELKQNMQTQRRQYDQEMKRVEEEFNRKYEAFLEDRASYPRTILLKRQTELQNLMEQNIAFRDSSLLQLQQAEEEAMKPIRAHLKHVIEYCAKGQRLAFVLNTDNNNCLFVDTTLGVDLQEDVTAAILTWGNTMIEYDDDGNETVVDVVGD